MPIIKQAGLQVLELSWDFAVDGGTVGTYEMTNRNGSGGLPVGSMVVDAYFHCRGSISAESGATCAVGDGNDANFYVIPSSIGQVPANYMDNVKNFDDNQLRTLGKGNACVDVSPETYNEFVNEYRQNCRYIASESRGKIYMTIAGNTVNTGQLAFFIVFLNPTYSQVNG